MAASSPSTGATTLSTTTTYELPSPHSYSSATPRSSRITSDDDDDDDQIVWSVSEGDMSFGSAERLEGVTTATTPLEMRMSTLSLSPKTPAKKNRKSKRPKKATTSSLQDTTTTTNQQRNNKRSADVYPSLRRSPKHADVQQAAALSPMKPISAFEHLGLGQRPIVDDLSDRLSVVSGDKTPTVYEEASTYISTFLSNPDAQSDVICRLTLLQSLIIELGLGTASALPATLSAARAFLKTHAFLNVREYIAVREQGPEAVQSVMYPSRKALIKSIKKNKNATSIKWVKELGLQVLLVGYMH